jgi:hypothetical protein
MNGIGIESRSEMHAKMIAQAMLEKLDRRAKRPTTQSHSNAPAL